MHRIWIFLVALAMVSVAGVSLAIAEPVVIKKPDSPRETTGESTGGNMDHVVGEELC